MAHPVLPPKYYQTHFFEMLDFVENYYVTLLDPVEASFISTLKSLSVSAQCTYVRMVNRKGVVFDKKKFAKYTEIENIDSAFDELSTVGYIRGPLESDRPEILQFLTKVQLMQWLKAHQIEFLKSLSRDELIEVAKKNLQDLKIEFLPPCELVIQQKAEQLEYIMFLFFGKIQKNLTLYTLRDLGIRQSQTLKTEFVPRFVSAQDARTDYFFVRHLYSDWIEFTDEQVQQLFTQTLATNSVSKNTKTLKDDLLFRLGEYWMEESADQTLKAWSYSESPMAREKSARLLFKLDRKNDCIKILEDIQRQPRSDEELLFAEDFYLRKFNKKRKSTVTEILQQSQEIALSEAYLKRPELGVVKYFEAQGHKAEFSENNFWGSLFGLIFWSELFESQNARLHNPFERSPSDLAGPEFYINHEKEIERKLGLLTEPSLIEKDILRTMASNYGRLNDVFKWSPDLAVQILSFIKKCKDIDLAKVLRVLAQNFSSHHVGFPDLMVEKDGAIQFIEVKAEGDSLRPNQLSRLRLLKEAGFGVDVLRVRWEADPEQAYVVVDVETTGGTANLHRITEIGAVKIKNGIIVDEFQTLINPGRSIPEFITRLTGISNEMVADAPAFSEIGEKFLEFTSGAIFVAHNVRFDYSFIQREFQRVDIEFVRPLMCTCAGIKKIHRGLISYGLKNLTQHFNIELTQHHRAMSDARAAAELFLIMNRHKSETHAAELQPTVN